jgi:Uncharacterized conserved protein (DUF2039)
MPMTLLNKVDVSDERSQPTNFPKRNVPHDTAESQFNSTCVVHSFKNFTMPIQPQQKKKQSTTSRKPAHQNSFAFRHNPNSKKTIKILNSPNEHVCRRCHDKIEWRKQYRKYKPLTKPTKCNWCLQPFVVKAAYHTICIPCTTNSPRAKVLLDQWNKARRGQDAANGDMKTVENVTDEHDAESENDSSEDCGHQANLSTLSLVDATEVEASGDRSVTDDPDSHGHSALGNASVDEDDDENQAAVDSSKRDNDEETLGAKSSYRRCKRVCAMCAKEPALPADDDDEDGKDFIPTDKPLRLRQLKSLERQKLKLSKKKSSRSRRNEPQENDECEDDEDDADSAEAHEENGLCSNVDNESDDGDDAQDPFLLAVGGADKLLVGDAYRAMLLARANQQQPE